MGIGGVGDAASAGGARQKADLHEIRLIDVLDGHGFLTDSGGDGFQTYRSAAVELNDAGEKQPVDLVKSQLVNFLTVKRHAGDVAGDDAVADDLREIADAAEKAVGDAGGTP